MEGSLEITTKVPLNKMSLEREFLFFRNILEGYHVCLKDKDSVGRLDGRG